MENINFKLTKENPVFKAVNDFTGYIQYITYKQVLIGDYFTDVFAYNYVDAINHLFDYIKNNKEILDDYPKSKFVIYLLDGTIDKYGEGIQKPIYTISSKQAKKLILK